jgi:hypothetical protein
MCLFTTSALHSPCLVHASFVNKPNSTAEGWVFCLLRRFKKSTKQAAQRTKVAQRKKKIQESGFR